ncbi:MAG: PKD domain-containing protein [Baekduia sp.]
MRHATRLALTATLALAIADVPATAAPTWLAPTTLDGNHDGAVSAATNANGDTILGLRDTSHGAPYLASAGFRPAGGPTTAVTAVAPAAAGSTYDQDVAINSRGDAALVWTDAMSIWLAMRPAGDAGFSSPISIAPSGTDSAQVAIDDAGAVVMAWTAPSGGKQLVFFTVRNPDGTLGPISSSAAGQDATSPTVAAARDGHAVVAWSRSDGTHNVIQAATRTPGTTSFVPTGDLSDSTQSADSADAAIADGGHAAITWSRTDGTHTIVEVARRQGEGVFSSGQGLSPTTVDSHHPTVAVNTAGQVLVSWSTDVAEADARVGSLTGDFGPLQVLSPYYGGGMTDAALNDDGMGLVTWVGVSHFTCVECANAWASIMPPGGMFGTPLKISPDSASSIAVQHVQGASAGIDAEGNAVAYARTRSNGDRHMYERLYDGAGPRLDDLSMPTAATAGTSAAFTVEPFDVISPVASTSWSFGDGSPAASGTGVQHNFTAAGSYDVTVTSTDAVGNASSATRKVTVAAAPIAPQLPKGPPALPVKAKAPVKCKVPSLKNLSVVRAKAKLRSRHCKLGTVTTPRKLKRKHGLVVRSQSPKAGSSTVSGTKVNVMLGTKPKPRKRVRGR